MEKLLNIPTWDLSDLYSSIKSGEISKDLEKINKDIKLLSKRYKNKIELINALDLHKAINHYEQVQEKLLLRGSLNLITRLLFSRYVIKTVHLFVNRSVTCNPMAIIDKVGNHSR